MAIKPISVGQVNQYISRVLRTDPLLGNISVIGEVSNLKFHNTGHVYFSLKDNSGRINCFLPYDRAKDLRFNLSDELEIIAYGYVSVYERGGSYSLNIKDIEVKGQGNLSIAFNNLKKKLEEEGLFSSIHKKAIPEFPNKIAIMTAETGAALQDILKTVTSRNNMVDIFIYPITVQGPDAAPEISKGIKYINDNYNDIDTIILGRGGGSMEDLWAFNEEMVARSIFESRIPIISAVGHEVDVTISDFVADSRAATPTAAGVMAVPNLENIRANSNLSKDRLLNILTGKIDYMKNLISLRKSRLDGLSPYRILSSGYGAILDSNRKSVLSVSDINENDQLTIVLKDGEICVKAIGTKRREIWAIKVLLKRP